MTLEKLLCGMPLESPIPKNIILTTQEKEEAQKLLNAVIQNWNALKTASPEGLQEGFIQREGKLIRRTGGWLLQIERKALDILVDRLPWGFGMIMLPWMPERLNVEWV